MGVCPCATVRRWMIRSIAPIIEKTRVVFPPLTVIASPPSITSGPPVARISSWVPSVMVPATLKVMVSVSTSPVGQASTAALVLAAWMASRRAQSPSLFSSSARVVTVIAVWVEALPAWAEESTMRKNAANTSRAVNTGIENRSSLFIIPHPSMAPGNI